MTKQGTAYIHTVEYYSAIRRKRNLAVWDNMNKSEGYYAKWNVRERQISRDLTCESKKQNKGTNKRKWKQTHTENKWVLAKGRRYRVGWNRRQELRGTNFPL